MGDIVSSILDPITGAGDTRDAADAAAAAQRKAAQAAAFRPVGMTTRFGTSTFERAIDPKTKLPYIKSAEYTAAPELAALQERLFSQFVPSLAQAESIAGQYAPLGTAADRLMSLGQQYLATSPEQASQDYLTNQQRLLAGPREQQLASLRNKVFQTGRSGLGVGGTTTGQVAANPEMQAYYNALANQDLQLAAQADQYGQQRTLFGNQLMGAGGSMLGALSTGQSTAYTPLQNILGLSGSVENMAQMPYNLGLQLGQLQQPGQQAYQQGMNAAANTQYQGAMQAASLNSAFLNNLIGSAAGAYGMSSMGGGATGGGFGLSTGSPGGYVMGSGNYLGSGVSYPGFGLSPYPSTSPFSAWR